MKRISGQWQTSQKFACRPNQTREYLRITKNNVIELHDYRHVVRTVVEGEDGGDERRTAGVARMSKHAYKYLICRLN